MDTRRYIKLIWNERDQILKIIEIIDYRLAEEKMCMKAAMKASRWKIASNKRDYHIEFIIVISNLNNFSFLLTLLPFVSRCSYSAAASRISPLIEVGE